MDEIQAIDMFRIPAIEFLSYCVPVRLLKGFSWFGRSRRAGSIMNSTDDNVDGNLGGSVGCGGGQVDSDISGAFVGGRRDEVDGFQFDIVR